MNDPLVAMDSENAWDVLAAHYGHNGEHAHVQHTIGGPPSPFGWLDSAYVLVCCNSVLTPLGHVPLPGHHATVLLSLN